ncbi:UbiX family flavin prenyltransferase [Paraburkholderia unamae]|uniref:Flavin prenyltransferase UbiX n=1 Tax=Paraburkholderia unamae TaxID=219649 RepID=A0ABX5KCL5_9BURK|nr:UbiX family flavin prenyltransferase [Paraburkholderia unamae]PVX74154.1 4-hydroxy-3-polyprenylbenzoate decarboxylase [Paraburkholderia unamae]RAR55769.1 4-hydroxy-3-polyprenylbenzoate decarboxylase [Paraburkholderia unamae]
MNTASPASSAVARPAQRRLIIAITGATGAIYGVRMLDVLRRLGGVETHLLVSAAGWLNIQHELQITKDDLHARADVVHSVRDVGATIASGSFATDGMIVAPCSMKTLASVAHGLSDNLIARAADVTLKERRRLVLLVRETPFNLAHLRNMTAVTEMGGVIFPPLPAFYNQPASIDEMVDHTVARVLDLFALGPALSPAWPGLRGSGE